jgi:hypothetical protein
LPGRFRALAVGVVAVVAVLISATDALAYNGAGAAAYADRYALSPNPSFLYFGSDCTNFVSQAMYLGGGHHFVGSPYPAVYSNRAQWWVWGDASGRTTSWSVADDLHYFLQVNSPGGVNMGEQFGGAANYPYSPVGVVKGDIIFYDFDVYKSSAYTHATIQVGVDKDYLGHGYGNVVDEHTSPRKHAIWNLIPYNSQWQTTSVSEWHIPSNA